LSIYCGTDVEIRQWILNDKTCTGRSRHTHNGRCAECEHRGGPNSPAELSIRKHAAWHCVPAFSFGRVPQRHAGCTSVFPGVGTVGACQV